MTEEQYRELVELYQRNLETLGYVDPDAGVIDQFYLVRDKARHSYPLWFVVCGVDGRVFTVAVDD